MTAALRQLEDASPSEESAPSATVATFSRDGSRFAVLAVALDDSPLRDLSIAEREVAVLAIQGLGNDEIASRRRTSVHTVANQMASIFRKLAVASRCHLAARLALCPWRRGES
ncbi:MAG TPA: helix-turn-helix transcriptional regulator [Polyangiaceae bacterium]|nr:helix-turn-helix transcriptional regulator [Polyangiaceae bacterium]